ncbi:MAG TPA: helix-turn-helix transcriptional regulator [Streptosporangiaceae bacterium]|nr:helix-turn-helix transcriptional regulator [Streptosporangiaceae bacterium]
MAVDVEQPGFAQVPVAPGIAAIDGAEAERAAERRRVAITSMSAVPSMTGMVPVTVRDSLLARTDAAARTASPLSPRETEVAGLIAQAWSNRQVTDRLVLSERTVEMHVRNIMAKLGVATRVEIAAWARP